MIVRTTIFDATDRRRYEEELLAGAKSVSVRSRNRLRAEDDPPGASADPGWSTLGIALPLGGERAMEVGGDWYDAFWLEEGPSECCSWSATWSAVGFDAAAAMGQIRSATRALAFADARTRRGCSRNSTGSPAYHGFGRLEHRRLRRARDREKVGYGSPTDAPVTRRRSCLRPGERPPDRYGAAAQFRSTAHIGGAPRRDQATITPRKRDTGVVLYTDGLVERPGRLIDTGIDWLAGAASERSAKGSQALAESLLDSALGEGPGDDACLLAMRLR